MTGALGYVETQRVVLASEDDPLLLRAGGRLDHVEVAYETYGTLSPEADNAVFVCHALTGDAHAAGVAPDGRVHRVPSTRIDTPHTHGTGCSLSSALATRLGAGDEITDALTWSTHWLHESIAHAADLKVGHGSGPVDHFHRARRLQDVAGARPCVRRRPPHPRPRSAHRAH